MTRFLAIAERPKLPRRRADIPRARTRRACGTLIMSGTSRRKRDGRGDHAAARAGRYSSSSSSSPPALLYFFVLL